MPDAPTLRTSGAFVLRTPALPFEELQNWADGVDASAASQAAGPPSPDRWAAAVDGLRTRLRDIVARPEVVQALFVASPSLVSSLSDWRKDPDSRRGMKAERALVRYFARMCGRPTPFGIFSGCSLGKVDENDATTRIELEPLARCRTTSRLDFDYLFAITTGLSQDPVVRRELRYEPNPTLRRIGDVWHAVESRVAGRTRSHHLIKLYSDEFLESTIARARGGARIDDLVRAIRGLPSGSEFAEDEATAYIEELIGSEVLVSTLSPLVTGEPPLDGIIATLQHVEAAGAVVQTLCSVRSGLAELDRYGVGVAPAEYQRLAESLESLPAEVDIAKLFQVDMTKPTRHASLAKPVIESLIAGVSVLCRIGQLGEPDDLRNFREAFSARYERAWVPLVEALDEDTGVPFGAGSGADSSPLLRGGLQRGRQATNAGPPLTAFQARLLRKLAGRSRDDCDELVLGEADMPAVENAWQCLPDAFDMSAVLVAESIDAVNAGEFKLLLKGGGGPSGARMIGRFCHVDPAFEQAARRHVREEESLQTGAAFAEIVYLPEGRVGNVLCRPVLRDYEIVCMGRSGAPRERQLPLGDLWVSVAADGTMLLYSDKLGRMVIPRLTNAHGYMNPGLPPVYRFLACLQHQGGGRVPSFTWGPLDVLDYLPRVRCGRHVISVARWIVSREEIEQLDEPDRCKAFEAMQRLRERRRFPRWVVLVEADNTLAVDLDNPLNVDALLHVMKRTHQSLLAEMYPGPDELCITGPEGRFSHELLVPFVFDRPRHQAANTLTAIHRAVDLARERVPIARRTSLPGGEWLYVKIYGGESALDDVLAKGIQPMLRQIAAGDALSGWFFIRYSDPEPHLRVRFKGRPQWLAGELLPLVHRTLLPLRQRGRIWRVQIDTYEREMERYGGPEGMALAEQIFCADSEAVLDILKELEGDEGLDARWRIALLGAHRLFDECGIDEHVRRDLTAKSRDALSSDLHIGVSEKKRIGDRFRAERSSFESLLESGARDDQVLRAARAAFDRRAARTRSAVEQLRELAKSDALRVPVIELTTTYVHLHVNRMMRSAAKAHEVMLYDFLTRVYEGRLARMSQAARATA